MTLQRNSSVVQLLAQHPKAVGILVGIAQVPGGLKWKEGVMEFL